MLLPMPSHRTAFRRRAPAPLALVIALTGMALVASCGDSSVTDPYQEAAGVFLLKSIADDDLPALITASETQGTVEVTTGSLFMSSDRRFQETMTVRATPPNGTAQNGTAVATGTYTVVGDSVEFSIDARGSTPASKMQARLRGDTLTYSVFGRVVLYLKL